MKPGHENSVRPAKVASLPCTEVTEGILSIVSHRFGLVLTSQISRAAIRFTSEGR